MFTERQAMLRILDAALNRASEGLRVIEDYVRFALDDAHLTCLAKGLRHELAEIAGRIGEKQLLGARETLLDVGTSIETAAERQRDDLTAIATAAFKRLEQSLRSLEEFSKLLESKLFDSTSSDSTGGVPISTQFESLRYRVYTLERVIGTTQRSRARLAEARLYVLVDGGESADAFRQLVGDLVCSRVDLIQLRDKRLGDRDLLARALALRQQTRDTSTLAIVNDRPDIAALSHADGVHVGQDELNVKQVRSIVGAGPLVGVSTHSIEQARRAVLDGADYLGVGPTFPSSTKRFDEFPGPRFLAEVASEITLPVFAIGGITLDRIEEVRKVGLHRVAVGAAITGEEEPAKAARAFLTLLQPDVDKEDSFQNAELTESRR